MREPPIKYYLKVLDDYRTGTRGLSKTAMSKELGIPPETYKSWFPGKRKTRRPSGRYVRWIRSFLESRGILSARRWMTEDGLCLLRDIGFNEGDVVADFGSGNGDYTLMLAKVVGKTGKVYAVDKDKGVLGELMGRVHAEGLTNVCGVFVSHKQEPPTQLPMRGGTVDKFWASDVIHDGYFEQDGDKQALIADVKRVLRRNGFIAVHPVHMEEKRLKETIKGAGFRLDRQYRRVVLFHGHEFHRGSIFRYKKSR